MLAALLIGHALLRIYPPWTGPPPPPLGCRLAGRRKARAPPPFVPHSPRGYSPAKCAPKSRAHYGTSANPES